MNIRPLESLTKEELIELVKHERGDHNEDPLDMVTGKIRNAEIITNLYNFMGWLTTRDEQLRLSATDNAAPACDAIEEYLKLKNHKLTDDALAAAPQPDCIPDDWKETSPDIKAIKKGDMRVINGVPMTCTDPEIGRWQGSAPQPTEHCATCNDMGTVGNILNAEPCQDCTPASTTVKESLTAEPTDSEMLDWLIEESCTVLSFATGVLSRKYKVIDFHGDDVSVGDTTREAITKAMRGEE